MCGVAVGPVDLTRLIHYTIVTEKGFTIHKTGLPSPPNVPEHPDVPGTPTCYFHRTTRAIDIHLRDIFGLTMQLLSPNDPRKNMDQYRTLTDWSLLEEVRGWTPVPPQSLPAVRTRVGPDFGPRHQMEDGLQHDVERKKTGTRYGVSHPAAF